MSSKVNLLALVALLLAWLCTAAAGCVVFDAPQYECASDKDCAGQCSDVGVCVGRGKSMGVRLEWTVSGETPTAAQPSPCAGVDELEVRFSGDAADTAFRPVECRIGRVYFARIPDYYDQVTVIAYSESGAEIGRAQAQLAPQGVNAVRLDVQP